VKTLTWLGRAGGLALLGLLFQVLGFCRQHDLPKQLAEKPAWKQVNNVELCVIKGVCVCVFYYYNHIQYLPHDQVQPGPALPIYIVMDHCQLALCWVDKDSERMTNSEPDSHHHWDVAKEQYTAIFLCTFHWCGIRMCPNHKYVTGFAKRDHILILDDFKLSYFHKY